MKRMDEYGAQAEAGTLELARPQSPEQRREELRQAEDKSVRLAKLAASEAWEEVRELIGESRAQRLKGQLKDPAKSAQYLATTGAILTDKALLLEGRPTSITQHQDLDDILKGLNQVAPGAIGYDTEATAEEIPGSTEVPQQPRTALKQDSKSTNSAHE